MKALLAVVTAFLMLCFAWLMVAGLFYLMGMLVIETGQAGGLMFGVHVFLMWVLSPGVAGYLAVFVTAAMFRSVPLQTIYVGLVSVAGVLTVLLFLVNLLAYSVGRSTVAQTILLIFQVAAIFVGARVARSLAERARE